MYVIVFLTYTNNSLILKHSKNTDIFIKFIKTVGI